MDYEKLKNILPKQPSKWTVSDMQIWLNFIGLSNLYTTFTKVSIDGSCLMSLTQEDLKNQLQIKSGIAVKKLLIWIRVGMKQYGQFLSKFRQKTKILNHLNKQETLMPNTQTKNIALNTMKYPIKFKSKIQQLAKNQQQVYKQRKATIQKKENIEIQEQQTVQKIQLIIHELQGLQKSFYSLKQQGTKIGRHSSNQIIVLEESISRFHAEIQYKNNQFYLKDMGSMTGTFIKITQPTQLVQGMIIQMGSNHFFIQQIGGNLLNFKIIDGPNIYDEIQIQFNKCKVYVGRKVLNQISFPQDQHLSNSHAILYKLNGKIYIQDLKTTNGTWLRLSPQGQKSQSFIIQDKLIFKIGPTLTYVCQRKSIQTIEKSIANACAICYQNEKDCVYIPCKHNAACLRCSKSLRECPICRWKIQDFIRIYAA